jgi:hypothetical protein
MSLRTFVLAAALCLLVLGAPPLLAAQVLVVIDATEAGEALTPGKLLQASDTITLPEGARLSLLNQQGELVLIKGPFSGAISGAIAATAEGGAEEASVMEKIAGLIDGKDSLVSFGAARAVVEPGIADEVPHPTLLSVMSPGPRCVIASDPQLWRSDAAPALTLTLKGAAGKAHTLSWAAGADRIALPLDLMSDGAAIDVDVAGRAVRIDLAVRPDAVRNLAQLLAWMAERGCKGQAAALLLALREEAKAAQ